MKATSKISHCTLNLLHTVSATKKIPLLHSSRSHQSLSLFSLPWLGNNFVIVAEINTKIVPFQRTRFNNLCENGSHFIKSWVETLSMQLSPIHCIVICILNLNQFRIRKTVANREAFPLHQSMKSYHNKIYLHLNINH